METTGIGGSATTAPTTAVTQFADNLDNFLKLLTEQLQHQDPLSPLDSTEFTAQLVQFTGVEQAISTNGLLKQLIGLQESGQATTAVGYLGKTVEIEGDLVALDGGGATFSYVLAGNADTTSISIADASGQVVRTIAGETAAGAHQYDWDGLDDQGDALPGGIYKISVAAASVSDGQIGVGTSVRGIVDGVTSVDGESVLVIDGRTVSLDDVISIWSSADDA